MSSVSSKCHDILIFSHSIERIYLSNSSLIQAGISTSPNINGQLAFWSSTSANFSSLSLRTSFNDNSFIVFPFPVPLFANYSFCETRIWLRKLSAPHLLIKYTFYMGLSTPPVKLVMIVAIWALNVVYNKLFSVIIQNRGGVYLCILFLLLRITSMNLIILNR